MCFFFMYSSNKWIGYPPLDFAISFVVLDSCFCIRYWGMWLQCRQWPPQHVGHKQGYLLVNIVEFLIEKVSVIKKRKERKSLKLNTTCYSDFFTVHTSCSEGYKPNSENKMIFEHYRAHWKTLQEVRSLNLQVRTVSQQGQICVSGSFVLQKK